MEDIQLPPEGDATAPPRYRARTLESAMQIKELWDYGYTKHQIGIALGFSLQTVSSVLRHIHGDSIGEHQAGRFLGKKKHKLDERDLAMKSLWDEGWPFSRIGTHFGLSRQRVAQILHRAFEELPKHAYGQPRNYCTVCAKRLYHYGKTGLCRQHFLDSRRVHLFCAECGAPLIQRLSAQKRPQHSKDKAFCNRVCFGRWIGKRYGFGRSKLTKVDGKEKME